MIPGSRAQDYLRERDPGFGWPKGGLTERSWAWRLVFLLFAVVALGIVVWVDEAAIWNSQDYPRSYLFNPLEDPSSDGSGWRFIADWLLVTAALWTPIWFLRRALTSWR